mmetsp:Transcript_24240/g.37397  ORF Transcript_24240/g.37397 Transcript_24240/m.37397 type:complete len:115 (-) Transcript_24240:934-1278(-)
MLCVCDIQKNQECVCVASFLYFTFAHPAKNTNNAKCEKMCINQSINRYVYAKYEFQIFYTISGCFLTFVVAVVSMRDRPSSTMSSVMEAPMTELEDLLAYEAGDSDGSATGVVV